MAEEWTQPAFRRRQQQQLAAAAAGGGGDWRPVVRNCNALATWHPRVTLLFADIKGKGRGSGLLASAGGAARTQGTARQSLLSVGRISSNLAASEVGLHPTRLHPAPPHDRLHAHVPGAAAPCRDGHAVSPAWGPGGVGVWGGGADP